jgi:uncharacterized membrane protein YphA (DoxX/SURF4 family)
MNTVVIIARLLLAAVFGVAGLAKLADPNGSRKSLSDFGVPRPLCRPISLLLPTVELATALALLSAASAWWGAVAALAILSLFIAAITASLMADRRPDCHCFGQLHSSPLSWRTLSRNALLAALAAAVLWQGPHATTVGVIDWLSAITLADPLVRGVLTIMAAAVAVQLWALLGLWRQNGRLLLRLEAVEARLGVKTERLPAGLTVGSVPPKFSLESLEGRRITFDILQAHNSSMMLFFTEPACPACDLALPDVSRWQREHAERLLIVLISRGERETNIRKSREHNLHHVLLQLDREVADAYHVDVTPSAVLVVDGVIANPLAAGLDEIRTLVGEATRSPEARRINAIPSSSPAPA